MADQYGHLDVKRYLPYAIVMTLAVMLVPILMVVALIVAADPNPPLFVTTSIGVVFGMLAVAVGSAWWLRKPDSSEISFGDLMIWGWWRRKRAEDRIARGTRLLGLDRSGHPRMHQTVSRERQLHILRELTGALESKDPYTHGHSRRVERHVYRTAMAMGLHSADVEDLRKVAALHDVGKIRVPDRILRKPEALTKEERSILEDHVVVGAWMVSSAGNADVVSGVRHHHEKWDGSGYPDGLAASEIPLFSRIIAVADTYDAITSTRPYRAGADRERAIEVLRAEAGRQFDPKVVEAFIQTLPAPVPATAGILSLLAGPRGIASRMAVMLKRAGAGALAPAAGATGAVILAGASTFAPPMVHRPGSVEVASRRAAQAKSTPQAPASASPLRKVSGNRHHNTSKPASHPQPSSSPNRASPTSTPEVKPTPHPTTTEITLPVVDRLALSPVSAVMEVRKEHSISATATSGGRPVEGVNILFTVAGSVQASGSCRTDPSGVCSFTYQGPDLPGADTVTACADVNNNSTADVDESCAAAEVSWIGRVLVVHAHGKGVIANAAGLAKVSFGFNVQRIGRHRLKGSCEIVDSTPGVDLTVRCLDVTSLDWTKRHVTVTGNASIGGVTGTYQIDVDDNAKQGKGHDRFQLQTSTGYSVSGVLVSGNIKVHRHWKIIEAPPPATPTPSPSPSPTG
jgi:HD domain